MRSLLTWTLAASVLALAAAGAAAAFSQPPLGGTSRSVTGTGNTFSLVLTTKTGKASHTCQKTSPKHNTVRKGKLIPIACEQPPRMNISTGGALAKAAAVDALG